MSSARPVLHATDFSAASRAAFDEALTLARERRAPLWIVHVLPPPVPPESVAYIPLKMYRDMEALVRRQAETRMASLLADARARGVAARPLLAAGVPHEEILRAARSRRAGAVVLGTHGRTGLARMLVGSVASRVVAGAACPVVTVRGRARIRRLRRAGTAGARKETR